jgi:hypothetical protein
MSGTVLSPADGMKRIFPKHVQMGLQKLGLVGAFDLI